jgi:hypothetical protein
VTVTELAVGVFLSNNGSIVGVWRQRHRCLGLAKRCIEAGNMFLEEGADGLADQFRRHLDETWVYFLIGSVAVAIVFGGLVLRVVVELFGVKAGVGDFQRATIGSNGKR